MEDGVVAAAACVTGVHDQFQLEPLVGAALAAVAPVGGVPAPVQTQFQDQLSPGAPPVLPGRSIERFRLEPPLTVTTLRSGLVPTAFAPFFWVTVPSLPGLPTRIETLMFCAPVCVALAGAGRRGGSRVDDAVADHCDVGPGAVLGLEQLLIDGTVVRRPAPPLVVSRPGRSARGHR